MAFRKRKLKNQRPAQEVCQAESIQNAASTLLANIRFSSVDEPLKTIVVTSSAPNEGKTTVALGLAIAAGRTGADTLVLECDMRRRSLRAVIGAKPRNGIHALLTGRTSLEEAVAETDFENVSFLDAEAGIPNPDGILSSRAFSKVLEQLHGLFDYVIIDTPPITAFPDASIVASKADATVVVAREKYTDTREISYALQQLKAAGANVLGIALNCLDSSDSSTYGYYYGYYYDEKEVAADSPEAKAALERIEKGDTSISVTAVGELAQADSIDEPEKAADDVVSVASDDDGAPMGGPTAAAPGSRK